MYVCESVSTSQSVGEGCGGEQRDGETDAEEERMELTVSVGGREGCVGFGIKKADGLEGGFGGAEEVEDGAGVE